MAYNPLPPLGQATKSASLPVTLASDQGAVTVTVSSSALPTGAATEATLSAMSSKLPASLGQKLMAASLAVVLASDQSALPVTGTFWQATQPVSIAATVAVSGPLTDTQLRASAVPVSVATLPLPTGAATEATLSAASAKLPATLGQKAMAASMAVVLASDQSTVPVSVASLPLPSGAATEATLSAMSAKLPATLGQKAMTASMAVVLASDQAAIPVTQSGTWNIGTVTTVTTVSTVTSLTQMNGQAIAMGTGVRTAGTQRVTIATDDLVPISAASLPLPTGAATEATLSAQSAKFPASLGQKTMANSFAVTLASDQSTVPVYRANATLAATQITALDAVVAAPAGAGATVSGASTAGSLVSLALTGGESSVDIFTTGGNYTGTVYFEGSVNSGNGTTGSWISLQGQRLGIAETTLAIGHTAAGAAANNIYRVPCAGFTYLRCRLVGSALTTGPTILMVASAGVNSVTLTSSLPTGANVIGSLVANQSVNLAQIAGTATSVNSGNKDAGTQRTVVATDQLAIALWGHGATAAAVPSNIVYHGGRGTTSNPTAVTDGQAVGLMTDKLGRLVTVTSHVRDLCGDQRTNVAVNTETTVVSAGAAGVFRDLTYILITTAGAAAQTITLKDSTGGTTRMVINYPNAAVAPGSPFFVTFNPPLKQTTAANNWTVTQGTATACNYSIGYVENK